MDDQEHAANLSEERRDLDARDLFAAHALQGLLRNDAEAVSMTEDQIATLAFGFADAMMGQR